MMVEIWSLLYRTTRWSLRSETQSELSETPARHDGERERAIKSFAILCPLSY